MEAGLPAVSIPALLGLFQIKNVARADLCSSLVGSQHSHRNKLLHWATDGYLQGMHWWSPSLNALLCLCQEEKILCAWIDKSSFSGFLLLKWWQKRLLSFIDCPERSSAWGWIAVTLVLGVVAAPGWYKPDWLGSSLMLEEMLGTKGNAKYCLQGLQCTTAHTLTCSDLQLPATESAGGTEGKAVFSAKFKFASCVSELWDARTVTTYIL